MNVCTAKFKVRNPVEALFVTDMVERVKEVTAQYNLPIESVRFGRQVKSWGARCANAYHVYGYKNGKSELWINGHIADMSLEGRKRLEWAAIYGCLSWDRLNKNINVDAADVTAFALKYRYKDCAQLKDYLRKRLAVDEMVGVNYAWVDDDRQAKMDAEEQDRLDKIAKNKVTYAAMIEKARAAGDMARVERITKILAEME